MPGNSEQSGNKESSAKSSVANQYAHSLYRNNIYQKKLDSHIEALREKSIRRQRVIEFKQFMADMRMKHRKAEWDRHEFSETRLEQKKFIEVMLARERADLEQKARLTKFAKERQRLADKDSDLNYLMHKYFKVHAVPKEEQEEEEEVEERPVPDEVKVEGEEKDEHPERPVLLVKDSETSLKIGDIVDKLREENDKAKRHQQLLKFQEAPNPVGLETSKVFAKDMSELRFVFKKKAKEAAAMASAAETLTAAAPEASGRPRVTIIEPGRSGAQTGRPKEMFIKKVNQLRIINRFRSLSRSSAPAIKSDDDEDDEAETEVLYRLGSKRASGGAELALTEIKAPPPPPAQAPMRRPSRPAASIYELRKQHEITQSNVQKNALSDRRFLDLMTYLKQETTPEDVDDNDSL